MPAIVQPLYNRPSAGISRDCDYIETPGHSPAVQHSNLIPTSPRYIWVYTWRALCVELLEW